MDSLSRLRFYLNLRNLQSGDDLDTPYTVKPAKFFYPGPLTSMISCMEKISPAPGCFGNPRNGPEHLRFNCTETFTVQSL